MRLNHIKARIDEQRDLIKLISTAVDNFLKVGDLNVTPQRATSRINLLKENWEQFSLQHRAIKIAYRELDPSDQSLLKDTDYFSEDIFSDTHEQYSEALEKMSSFLLLEQEPTQSSSSTQSVTQPSNIPTFFHHARLPRIDLPKFDGSQSDWLSFKDLFSSLVLTNSNLTPVEKLQYLKTSLIGKAAHLLKNTKITADNFQKAWEALISFYENERLLVNSTLHSLLTLKRMTNESSAELENLYTTIMQIYRNLETLQRPVQYWDDFLVFIAVSRLDAESVKAWEQHLGSSKETPSWDKFTEFLITRLLSMQAFEKSHTKKPGSRAKQIPVKAHFQGKVKENKSSSPITCVLCSAKHYIANCPKYTLKSVQQRQAIVNKHKLCYNCLGQHRFTDCRVVKRCLNCGHKHHTTIHINKKPRIQPVSTPTETKPPVSAPAPATNVKAVHSVSAVKNHPCVLLATAQVIVVSPNGESTKVRALLDQGSEISLISERLVQRMRLMRSKSSIPLVGIGGQKSNRTKGTTSFLLKPHYDHEFACSISAHILPKLTTSLPSVKSDPRSWKHLDGLLLADPDYCVPGSIDLIIGADIYGQIIEEGIIKGDVNTPLAQRTALGWIISGPSNGSQSYQEIQSYHASVDNELHYLLQRFWELEEVPSATSSLLSVDDQECEQHFQNTHYRDAMGKYHLRLPFKKPVSTLGESKLKATKIMDRLSKRLNSESPYSLAYSAFMNEYQELHHMERIPDSEAEPMHCYYLPHHGVLRDNNTSKIRVVFNGSSNTTSGYSLNDILHKGAKLQTDLINVLIWFRQFRYVFSSDMKKMYRQINVHPEDRDFQRILWIDNSNIPIVYQLTTVTYGLACAPFQALRTIQQLIEDEGANHPQAVPTLQKGRYVDDIFGGADSIGQAQEIVKQLTYLCMAGGFPLHKWVSNEPEILNSIPVNRLISTSTINIEEDNIVHVLGLIWNPTSDSFTFTLKLSSSDVITKRTILSFIARMFDPLGFLSPIIISAKILIQELWSLKLDWDDQLPSGVRLKWTQFIENLQLMPNLAFPRWINRYTGDYTEVHGFCDASQLAMAAVVYIRIRSSTEEIFTNLLCAKTKVAPLKRQTIPRLELSSAVLLIRLVSHVLEVIQLENSPVILWTDSAVSLTWINNHPSRWKDFVHNRVCVIQETLPHGKWRFVPGKQNPADYATRGLTADKLSELPEWWHGPSWLSQPESAWPTETSYPFHEDNLEERPVKIAIVSRNHSDEIWNLLEKYSSLLRLVRITATCLRAIARFRRTASSLIDTPLTTQELESARLFWIKSVQNYYFSSDIAILSERHSLPKSNKLVRLTPFMDSNGFLRVGGRLQASFLPESSKHPLILPKESTLTSLIISDAHARSMHGGTQLTTSFIRQEYWIVGGKAPVRSFILKCVKCARFRKERAQQLMGSLPVENLTPSRAFLHSGVDYAGPFTLKTWKGRKARTYKAYIALFVCHTTSAIHLELVTDYTTEAFIAAYKRFTSRRGICDTLMSDCGTNFIGADSELRTLLSSALEFDKLASLLANDGTQWKFNPPASPHFGGKWEAGVRSVKFHMRRVVGDTLLTYEEFNTLFTQIEAILNSRPLCPLTDDPEDLSTLTPGHFIMGSAPTVIPEPSLIEIRTSHLSRWQLICQMLQSFWKKWSTECLQRYMSIYKWNTPLPSLSVGSLVLLTDERYPPSKWPLGRVIQTHPGSDGLVRVVTVKTQASVLKRPVVKICPLPISS